MAQWVPLVWITMILKTQIPSYLNYKASFGFCQSFPKDKKKILQILLSTQGWNFKLWRWRISESKKPTQLSGSWWSVLWNWNKRQGSTLLQVIQVCSYRCSRLMLVNWLILHINYTVNEENSSTFLRCPAAPLSEPTLRYNCIWCRCHNTSSPFGRSSHGIYTCFNRVHS